MGWCPWHVPPLPAIPWVFHLCPVSHRVLWAAVGSPPSQVFHQSMASGHGLCFWGAGGARPCSLHCPSLGSPAVVAQARPWQLCRFVARITQCLVLSRASCRQGCCWKWLQRGMVCLFSLAAAGLAVPGAPRAPRLLKSLWCQPQVPVQE